jgi:plastocyanin
VPRFFTALTFLLLIIAACGGSDPTAITTSSAQPSPAPTGTTAAGAQRSVTPASTITSPAQETNTPPPSTATAAAPDDVRLILVTLTSDLAFKPGFIDVTAGEKVRFVLKNEAGFFHTFTIATSSGKEEILVDVPLNGGEENTVDLTIPEGTGDLYLFCKPHEFAGMVAMIVIDGGTAPTSTPAPTQQPTPTPTAAPAATAAPVPTATLTPAPTTAPIATAPVEPRIIPLATTGNLIFSPNVIQVSPGEKVKFLVRNTASFFHTFTVATSTNKSEILLDVPLNGGESGSIEMTMPEEAGELYIFCRPHEGLGMVGSITVVVAGSGSRPEPTSTPVDSTSMNSAGGNSYDY